MDLLKLGTRGSRLAMWQAEAVATRLRECHPGLRVQVVVIKTTGDKILDVALSRIGDKGLFTKELEKALLAKEIDVAVHSLKDLPSELGEGLTLAAVLEREHPGDVLVTGSGLGFSQLPEKSVLGTSSLRRAAQIRAARPDIRVEDIRGNVETRIKKMQESGLDGIVLAYAGVNRLGLTEWISEMLPYELLLPATGQGVIAIEARARDAEVLHWLQAVNHETTFSETQAERTFLRLLEGGCQVPIAALAEQEGEQLKVQGLVASLDGSRVIRETVWGPAQDPAGLGSQLAQRVLRAGADQILDSIRTAGDAHE